MPEEKLIYEIHENERYTRYETNFLVMISCKPPCFNEGDIRHLIYNNFI